MAFPNTNAKKISKEITKEAVQLHLVLGGTKHSMTTYFWTILSLPLVLFSTTRGLLAKSNCALQEHWTKNCRKIINL